MEVEDMEEECGMGGSEGGRCGWVVIKFRFLY